MMKHGTPFSALMRLMDHINDFLFTIFIMGTSCEPLPKYADSIQVGAVNLIMDRWLNC